MFYSIAPTGTPLKLKELALSIYYLFRNRSNIEMFQGQLRQYLGVKYCFVVSSGRAALSIILSALKDISNKEEVIIPAYTCFSIPSAIVKSGLKVRLCDLDIETLDYDYEKLMKINYEKVLCIVPSNLFGLVSDMRKISEMAKSKGIFVVDDAAQSLGAKLNKYNSGTMGDVGFYSLGRGKNITTLNGGIIVTNSDEIGQLIERKMSSIKERKARALEILFKLIVYSVFLHPRAYWIPERLPFLELGTSKFDVNFEIEGLSELQAALGMIMLRKLKEINETRRNNAMYIMKNTRNGKVFFPKTIEGSESVYLRLPVLVKEQRLREKIISQLIRQGIGVTKMYPRAIDKISGIKQYLLQDQEDCRSAQQVASMILSLPTHPKVKREDLDTIVEVLNHSQRNN